MHHDLAGEIRRGHADGDATRGCRPSGRGNRIRVPEGGLRDGAAILSNHVERVGVDVECVGLVGEVAHLPLDYRP